MNAAELQRLPSVARNERARRGLSLRAAATQIGLSYQSLCKFERGQLDARCSTLVRIVAWLGCDDCRGSDLGPGFLPSDWPCACNPDYWPPAVGVIDKPSVEMPERLRRLEAAGRLRCALDPQAEERSHAAE